MKYSLYKNDQFPSEDWNLLHVQKKHTLIVLSIYVNEMPMKYPSDMHRTKYSLVSSSYIF